MHVYGEQLWSVECVVALITPQALSKRIPTAVLQLLFFLVTPVAIVLLAGIYNSSMIWYHTIYTPMQYPHKLDAADLDGDRSIDFDELEYALAALGQKFTKFQMDDMMKKMVATQVGVSVTSLCVV